MPIVDLPMITIKKGFTLWPVQCGVTKKTIPMFRMARRRWNEYFINNEVVHDFDWVSEEGYTYLLLTKKSGEVFYE